MSERLDRALPPGEVTAPAWTGVPDKPGRWLREDTLMHGSTQSGLRWLDEPAAKASAQRPAVKGIRWYGPIPEDTEANRG